MASQDISSHTFQVLDDRQQNLHLFRMLSKVLKAVGNCNNQLDVVGENLVTVKANTVEGRQQINKVIAYAERAITDINQGIFPQESKITMDELSDHVDKHVLPKLQKILSKSTDLQELHSLLTLYNAEISNDSEFLIPKDDCHKITKLVLSLRNECNSTTIIRKQWNKLIHVIWKKSGIFYDKDPMNVFIVKDVHVHDIIEFLATYLFMWFFHGLEMLNSINPITLITPDGKKLTCSASLI